MNQKNSEVEFKNLQDDVINNLFFDNLSISKSKLFIVNDTIQHKIDINNLNIIQIQKNTNGINFDISIFEGNIDNYSIDQFSGKFKLNDDKVVFENFLLSNENQYLEGDLDLYLNDDFSIKNFNDSYIKFKVDSDILNIDNNFFPKFISGELSFLGSKNNLSIEKALFFSDFFNVDSKIVIENGLSSNPIVKIDLKNLDFNKDKINTEYKIDDRINYPSVSGDLTLNDNIITYKFNQVDKTKTNLSIDGIAKLDDTLSYSFTLNSSIASEDKILDILNLNSLKINSNISGTKDQFFSMESSIFIIKDDKDFTLDINSLINNNDLNAKVDLSSENIKIFSNISGNNLNKTYKINSDMDLIIPDAQSLSFQTKAIIDVDFSELEYIKSLVSLQNIYLKNSENEIYLESFAEINNLLDANFIENITNYDFGIIYSNDKFSINSYLGDRFNFSGYYKNENDLDFNIQISDLYVSNFYKINQNPISGNIISNIGFNRTLENRTLEFNSNISDIKLKDYDLGELNLKVFGNTDYNSYAVDLDLSDKSNNQIKGEGTIIAINEKPNIDIDLLINDFDISFIERIGLKTMSEISSNFSGEVNLWGAYDNIQHNGKLFLNKSSFIVPYLNVEYLLSDKSEITLYNQNFELNNVSIKTIDSESITSLNGKIFHEDYKNWNLDLAFNIYY